MTLHKPIKSAGELLWFKGSLVNIRTSAGAGGDRISVIENTLAFGDSPPLHIHRFEDEVFHIIEGTMRFRVDGKDVVAHAGQTVLAPKRIPHTFRVESQDGARCLIITTGGDFERMVREMSEPAQANELPPHTEMTPDRIEALTRACARNNIEIVGPPLV